MNNKTIAKNSNDKTKLSGIDSASIDVYKVNANLLKAIKVDTNGNLTAMKISTNKTAMILRELL